MMRVELQVHETYTIAAIYATDGHLLGRGYGRSEGEARDDALDDWALHEARGACRLSGGEVGENRATLARL